MNPIDAFVEARGTGGVHYFSLDRDEFGFGFDIPDPVAFASLLREVLDWRLAQYLSRTGEAVEDIVCRVARNNSGHPILFLPNGNGERLPEGILPVQANGRRMNATVAKIAINVVREEEGGPNRLPDILNAWLGSDAGLPGRGDRVRLRRSNGGFVLEPLRLSVGPSQGLVPWERYLRQAIPPAFGEEFSQAIWNAGFVTIPPHIFLLITLEKDGMMSEHRYNDRFLSDQEFSWQSQNRTTRTSKHGQMIAGHHVMGIHVHLLVRPTKKTGSKPTPFTYCGEVDFVSWEGEAPITVRWRLKQAIPPSLRSTLRVP